MKTGLMLTISILISSVAFAQTAADKSAATAAAKANGHAADPAQPAAQTADAKPAKAAPAAAAPVDAAPADAAPAATEDGAAHSCPCDKKISGLKDALAMHEDAMTMLKKDPIMKVKGFKGKAKKMYTTKAKQDKAFHTGMAKLLKKQVKFLEKMHSGGECKMHKAMEDAPDEVKAILKDRHAKMEERMKEHGAKMGEMHGDHQ